MRLTSTCRAAILTISVISFGLIPIVSSQAAGACTATLQPGDDLQASLDAAPNAATLCLSSGTYTLSATLRPKFRQTILGLSDTPRPVILCPPPIIFCMDGSLGPEKVRLTHLVFDGARAADLRTGNGWKLSYIEARNAGAGGSTSGVGIVVNGSKVSITHSFVHDNWQFGIRANNASNLTIKQTEVSFNPTDPAATAGFSGGMKFNSVVGLLAKKNSVHDNGGGAGMWLDVDSQNFQLVSNRVTNNEKDAIRVETSCYGSLESNITDGGNNAAIDLFNSHDVTATSNVVTAPAAALFGLRMLNNGRTATVGTGACLIDGVYQNVNNLAATNSITLNDPSTIIGIDSNGGIASNNIWSGNVFAVPDCASLQWQWWDGSAEQMTDFLGWQAFGQDLTGSCTSTMP